MAQRNLTGTSTGQAVVGVPFRWGDGSSYAQVGIAWGGTLPATILRSPSKNLSGTAAGAASVSAALARQRSLVGTSVGVGVTTAAPARRRPLSGASVGTATVSGGVSVRRSLVAVSAGKATTLGLIDKAGSVFRQLFGTSAGVALTTAIAARRRSLVVASTGASATSAAPSRRRALVAASNGRAIALATMASLVYKNLAGTANGQAGASGQVSGPTVISVVWVGDHFEIGRDFPGGFKWGDGTRYGEPGKRWASELVKWDTVRFQSGGSFPQVIWQDDVFKVAV